MLPSLVIGLLVIGHCSLAHATGYDGIWFLGFNLNKAPFNNLAVRQAVAHSLHTSLIANKIAEDIIVPGGVIPFGMVGSDPALKPYKYNPKFAKSLIKKAGYKLSDPVLKSITLLHTDGDKTVAIARQIQKDFKQIGMRVDLLEIPYREQDKWAGELGSGKYGLFLMGYKAESEELFSQEASPQTADSYRLLEPLFRTSAEANFTGYSNPNVDKLLDQVSVIGISFSSEREEKFRAINKLLYKELPVIGLFYIEKL